MRKENFLLPFVFFLFTALAGSNAYAQTTKGFSTAKQEEKKQEGKTYALIVGISKYKNTSIPPLQFADRDAIAFRNYLVATGVDSNNVTLLVNEKATNTEFWTSIGFLTDVAKQGDKVYIYFSGHGDVENKTVVKDAYLLPYDAPKCVYPAGAIAVQLLKSWIATLSANGIQAVFIADACHSGNLAGGREGMEAAAAMLKDKWQDEIKILSCQPGELSLEGKQWGDGRGLFSYELVNGLTGLADKNKDGKVSLREMNLYLTEKVPDEASPLPQNPMLFGNMEADIANVNQKLLAEIRSQEKSSMITAIDIRGFDETLLVHLNDSIKINYRLFKLYLDSGLVVSRKATEPSAFFYAQRIPVTDSTRLLAALVKQNLSAALLNDIQDELNRFITNQLSGIAPTIVSRNSHEATLLRQYVGDKKLRELGILPKVLFAEAMSAAYIVDGMDRSLALSKLDTCLTLDSTAAYAYFAKSYIYHKMEKLKEQIESAENAIRLSPSFAYAYLILGYAQATLNMHDSAIATFRKVLSIDQSRYIAVRAYRELATEFKSLGEKCKYGNCPDSAKYYFQKMLHIGAIGGISQTAYTSMGDVCFEFEDYQHALFYYRQSLDIEIVDSSFFLDTYSGLTRTFSALNIHDSVAYYKQKAIEYFERENVDTLPQTRLLHSGEMYYNMNDFDSASIFYKKVIDLGINDKGLTLHNFTCSLSMEGKNTEALSYLEEALKAGFNDFDGMKNDIHLNNIRNDPRFIALMKKYFPEQYKTK